MQRILALVGDDEVARGCGPRAPAAPVVAVLVAVQTRVTSRGVGPLSLSHDRGLLYTQRRGHSRGPREGRVGPAAAAPSAPFTSAL